MAINNQSTFLGRLGQNPELKEFNGGKLVKFSLAVNDGFKDKEGNWKEQTTWINVVCFNERKHNYIMKFGQKGTQALIQAKYQVKEHEGKQYPQFILEDITLVREVKQQTDQKSGEKNDDLPF